MKKLLVTLIAVITLAACQPETEAEYQARIIREQNAWNTQQQIYVQQNPAYVVIPYRITPRYRSSNVFVTRTTSTYQRPTSTRVVTQTPSRTTVTTYRDSYLRPATRPSQTYRPSTFTTRPTSTFSTRPSSGFSLKPSTRSTSFSSRPSTRSSSSSSRRR